MENLKSNLRPSLNVEDLQNIKAILLGKVELAENPYDIIYALAKELGRLTNEEAYAQNILANLRSIYGLAIGEKKLLQDELEEVEARIIRIEKALKREDFTEEEQERITFALSLHKKTSKCLENRIKEET